MNAVWVVYNMKSCIHMICRSGCMAHGPYIVAVFGGEIDALRYATSAGHRIVLLPYGMTLLDARDAGLLT